MSSWVLAIAIVVLPSPSASAQGRGLQSGGQIERELRRVPEPKPARKALPSVVLPKQVRREDMDAIRLDVRSFVLQGGTVYPAAELQPYYQRYVGREVSLRELYDLADALTDKYQGDGYILSQVVIPDQVVVQGVITLRAVEGYVAEVKVSDDRTASGDASGAFNGGSLIEQYVREITRSRPLRAAVLERYLLLVNDLPGVFASATLTPLADPGDSALLSVQISRSRFGGALGVDNLGSRSLGPWRLTADTDAIGMLRDFDYTAARFVTTGSRELNYLSLFHEQPAGSEGLKINFFASAVESQPEPADSAWYYDRLETRSRAAGLGASYPLLRSRARNLYLKAAFTAHNGETEVTGFRPTEDRVRAVRVAISADAADALQGVNALDAELSQGLKGFGASDNGSPHLSRPSGRVDFSKLTAYAARLQALVGRWSLLAAVDAQYAFTDLLVGEQFAFGGERIGRGYDAAELIGDSGAALKLELRYSGTGEGAPLGAYTLYAYYDVGTVWLRTAREDLGEERRQSAASAGVGARANLGERASGFIEVAQPLTRDVAAERDRHARLFGGVSLRF